MERASDSEKGLAADEEAQRFPMGGTIHGSDVADAVNTNAVLTLV